MSSSTEKLARQILKDAGIAVNGNQPWDIHVNDRRFYDRVVSEGSIGFGESYMDDWWNCEELDEMFSKLVRSKSVKQTQLSLKSIVDYLQARFFNLQSKDRSTEVGQQHYDIGNELFEGMLDASMTYSCGYWKNARNLEQAQKAKLDLICRKIDLHPGMRILDIGCGWGGFAKYAAEQYGVQVVGITISAQQYEYAKERCQGLPIEIRLQDYRDVTEIFDRVVSIGQFEHVGHKNYPLFFQLCRQFLKDDGLFLLHTIGSNTSTYRGDPWLEKYIFPGGALPSITQIGSAIEEQFVMEDWHNFSSDYDKTLMAWHANFNREWNEIKHNYSPRFFRMWNYYLLLCAGCFRARYLQLWQIVLSPDGVKGGYESIR
jgi:cyclopropane-fatty-acyl-phospholipid synthase